MISVGENIRTLRKKAGLTQKALAKKVGINEVTIRSYEAGKYAPKIETLKKIASALNCQVSDIDESIIIIPIPKFEPTPEDIERYKKNAEARKLIERIESGETLTSEEQQKIIDYGKQLKFEAKQREEAAKNAPKFFTHDKKGNIVKDGKAPKFTTASRSHAQTEAYDLFHSLLSEEWIQSQEQEMVAIQLRNILGAYKNLNDAGKREAVKRIDELTEIPRYTNPDEPPEE